MDYTRAMRKITKNKGISLPSLVEVRHWIRQEAERAGDELGLKVEPTAGGRMRAPSSSHLLNWVACYLLSRDPAQRNGIILEGKRVFDLIAASDVQLRSIPADSGAPCYVHPNPLGVASVDTPGEGEAVGENKVATDHRRPARRPRKG